jgi:hypothetical protein
MRVEDFGETIRLSTPIYTFDKEPMTPVESAASFLEEEWRDHKENQLVVLLLLLRATWQQPWLRTRNQTCHSI